MPCYMYLILCFYVLFSMAFIDKFQSKWSINTYVDNRLYSSAVQGVDLTPAVDKFINMPVIDNINVPRGKITAEGLPPNKLDPFALASDDIHPLSDDIKELLQSETPVLTMAASHFFDKKQGKQFRPTIITLLGRVLGANDAEYLTSTIRKKHVEIGRITEIIHIASLIHDDVVDDADTRRGGSSVHKMYTNKVAVLAGDFLLAKSSGLLARLRDVFVIEVMSSALEALVQGEIMQARSKADDLISMNHYLRKTYFKTASLICCACKSCALLSGYDDSHEITRNVEEFGHHLGMAYQIIDDILDFTGASSLLGKPAQADMKLGLATAPVLYASEQIKELKTIIQRRFKNEGDVPIAMKMAMSTNCVMKSYELAEYHAEQSSKALLRLPSCESRDALLKLIYLVISRKK